MDDSNIKNNNQETLPEKLSGNSFLYYFYEVDWTLSRILSYVFNSLSFLFLISLSLFSLGFGFIEIFEYKEGLSDISTIEIVFTISALVLLKRYLAYCKQTSTRWWNMVKVPIVYYGKFLTITWLVISLLAISDLKESTTYFNTFLIQGQNLTQLLDFIFILISLYISIPSKKLRIKKDKASCFKQPEPATVSQPEQNKTEAENAQ